MADNEILSVAVVNKVDMEYKGFVDVMDILTYAIDLYTEGRKMEETGWQRFLQVCHCLFKGNDSKYRIFKNWTT